MEKGKCVAANMFSIRDVLQRAGISAKDAAATGAEILVKAKWADMKPMLGSKGASPCNLDARDWREACAPSFEFRRLDDAHPNSFSHGYNFRVSEGGGAGASARRLIKWTGIRVIIMIEGQGGLFDLMTTMQHLGAGLALMSVATLVADAMICYMLSDEETATYKKRKFEDHEQHADSLTEEEKAVLMGQGRVKGDQGGGGHGYQSIPDPA
jgi:hypothetical protein